MELGGGVAGSSEDEETALWRAELQRQVEEDLERQVRLRLGLPSAGSITERDDLQDVVALSRYVQFTKHLRRSSRDDERCCEHPSEPGGCASEEVPGGVEREEELGSMRERTRFQKENFTAMKLKDLGERTQLLLHLNKHHGAPLSQLRQLSSGGSYRTRGGGGEGGPPPHIQWPLEACIVHPTPHHITSSPAAPHHNASSPVAHLTPFLSSSSSQILHHCPQHIDRQSTVNTSSMSVATAPSARPGGRLIYTCSESWAGGGKVEEGQLVFESRFESGNLYQARQTGSHDYTLILNPDLYSKRHVQWYYFRVSNMETTPIYTFHIVNFEKKKSLYSKGLQPLLYSEHDAGTSGMGWRRVGWNVSYSQSRVRYPPHMSLDSTYFTLSWSMKFHCHGDTCYLAHCYPYPLSTLYRLLDNIEEDKERAKYFQKEELCQTLAGNSCPLLTITEFSEGCEGREGCEGEEVKKRGVVVTARVHPGETNSSWMMEGLLLFLTSESPHAHALRKSYVFKLVPMLNPDGVVVGNYRTSLAGVDLNRVFRSPVTAAFPTISHTKKMMNIFQQEREVCVYVDLHGHSRKQNVFMYGCHTPKVDHTQFLYERLLPFLLSEQAPNMFCLASCKFAVQRCKEATGRVVTWRSGVPNSFTLEATFCGSNLGPTQWQFCESDLLCMGRNLGKAFYKFSQCLQSKTYQLKVMARLAEKLMNSLATPTDHAHIPPTSTLPDVVTSTTATHCISHSCDTAPRQLKKKARMTLNKFKKLDMRNLEEESSTSGSDSENQDFKFRRKKKSKGHERRQHRLTSEPETHSDVRKPLLPSLPHPSLPRASQSLVLSQQNPVPGELTLPPLPTQATVSTKQRETRLSAPAKLQDPKWKFVNRYSNRSNGGIPMFAEERLKERMEKRATARSEIHLPTEAPPLPGLVASEQETHKNPTFRPHPLWTNCIPELDKLAYHPSPRQHYKNIKELVEYCHAPSHLRAPPPPSSLSPHLRSYISSLWNN